MRVDLLVNNFTYIASKNILNYLNHILEEINVHVLDVVDPIFAIDTNNVKNEILIRTYRGKFNQRTVVQKNSRICD